MFKFYSFIDILKWEVGATLTGNQTFLLATSFLKFMEPSTYIIYYVIISKYVICLIKLSYDPESKLFRIIMEFLTYNLKNDIYEYELSIPIHFN